MSTIKEHLDNILTESSKLLNEHTTEADEFVTISELEEAVHSARKVFERTKEINETEKQT